MVSQNFYFYLQLVFKSIQESSYKYTVNIQKYQMKVCLTQSLVFSKQNVGQGHENCIYATVLAAITDYGHTMAKSLILCRPNSNPNPKQIFGIWM